MKSKIKCRVKNISNIDTYILELSKKHAKRYNDWTDELDTVILKAKKTLTLHGVALLLKKIGYPYYSESSIRRRIKFLEDFSTINQ